MKPLAVRAQAHGTLKFLTPPRPRFLRRSQGKRDASGNKLLDNVGVWLMDAVKRHFKDHPTIKPSTK